MSTESAGLLGLDSSASAWRRSSFKSANAAVCAWEAALKWNNVVVRFLKTTVRLLLPSLTDSLSSEPEGVAERSSVVVAITTDVRN